MEGNSENEFKDLRDQWPPRRKKAKTDDENAYREGDSIRLKYKYKKRVKKAKAKESKEVPHDNFDFAGLL